MKKTQLYEATDGSQFATAEECKKYERTASFKKLTGLTENDIARAMTREDPALADAFESVGATIAERRRESGELRRKKGQGTFVPTGHLHGENHSQNAAEAEMKRRHDAQRAREAAYEAQSKGLA